MKFVVVFYQIKWTLAKIYILIVALKMQVMNKTHPKNISSFVFQGKNDYVRFEVLSILKNVNKMT